MVKGVGDMFARENHMNKCLGVGKYLACLEKSKDPWYSINVVMDNETGIVNRGQSIKIFPCASC